MRVHVLNTSRCRPSLRHSVHRSRLAVFASGVTSQEASANYKRAAARAFVDGYIKSNMHLGLGSGELVNFVVEEVGRKLALGQLEGVLAVPACDAAAPEAAFHGVPLASASSKISVLVEQVDQLDVAANAAMKGVTAGPQQPQLQRLRAALASAHTFIVLADQSAVTERLGGTLPVVIDADNWEEIAEEVDDIFIGDAEIWRRAIPGMDTTPDPRGGDHPYVSPEGHNIIDIKFEAGLLLYSEPAPYAEIAQAIESVEGVVTHGLLLKKAAAAVIARPLAGPHVVNFASADSS